MKLEITQNDIFDGKSMHTVVTSEFSVGELADMDMTLAAMIAHTLRQFDPVDSQTCPRDILAKHEGDDPDSLSVEEGMARFDAAMLEWKGVYDQIVQAFESIAQGSGYSGMSRDDVLIATGLANFAKYYIYLWK